MKNKYFFIRTAFILLASQLTIESYSISTKNFGWKQALLGAVLVGIGAVGSSFLVFKKYSVKNSFYQTLFAYFFTIIIYSMLTILLLIINGGINMQEIFGTILLAPFLTIASLAFFPAKIISINLSLWGILFSINRKS
jgi:hypothetical protein